MARYLPEELDLIFPDPKASGWHCGNLTPTEVQSKLSWLESGTGDPGADAAMATCDQAGLLCSFGTAEILHALASNPAIGIQQSKAGLLHGLEALAGENFTLPVSPNEAGDHSWFGTLSTLSGSGSSGPVSWDGQRIRIDGTALAGSLGNLAIDKLATVAIGATAAIPFVGWLSASLLSVARVIKSKRDQASVLQAAAEEAQGWAQSSELCALPDLEGSGSSAWIGTADQIVAEKIVSQLKRSFDGTGCSAAALSEEARGSDLTWALLPSAIPSGDIDDGPSPSPGSYSSRRQDQDCAGGQGRSVFTGRIASAMTGSGYLPGLGFVGRPVFSARHGANSRGTGSGGKISAALEPAGLFERSDLGELLSGSAALCQTIEGLILRSPWCYQVETWTIRARWREAIEGWGHLEALARAGIDMLPGKDLSGLELFGRSLVSPAPWLTVSRVKIKAEGGQLVSAIRPGPELLGGGWPSGAPNPCPEEWSPFSPMNRANQDPLGVAWRRQMLEMMFGLRSGLDFSMWHPTLDRIEYDCGPGFCSLTDAAVARMDMFRGTRDLPMWFPTSSTGGELKHWGSFRPRSWGPDAQTRDIDAIPSPHWPGCSDMWIYRPQDSEEWRAQSDRAVPHGPEDPIVWRDRSGTFSASNAEIETWGVEQMCLEPYLQRVENKQRDALDTLQCAYVAHAAPAFKNGFLKEKLRERREQLLDHPARFEVNLADVMDCAGDPGIFGNYRELLKQSGVGALWLSGDHPGPAPEDTTWTGPGGLKIELYDPPPPDPSDDPEAEQEAAPPLPVPTAGSMIASEPDGAIPEVESDRARRAGLLVPVAIVAGAMAITRKG
jgi:hypothetical protein